VPLRVTLRQRQVRRPACVVDQQVEAAVVGCDRLQQRGSGVGVAHVQRAELGFAAPDFDEGGGRVGRRTAGGDDDLRPGSEQGADDSRANSLGTAGDHGDASGEVGLIHGRASRSEGSAAMLPPNKRLVER
jgi:hypothetical protein